MSKHYLNYLEKIQAANTPQRNRNRDKMWLRRIWVAFFAAWVVSLILLFTGDLSAAWIRIFSIPVIAVAIGLNLLHDKI